MKKGTQPIHVDQRFIVGLVNGDTKIIQDIYQICYPIIEAYVVKNSGTKEDAKDLFSESLKIIYLQGKEGLELHSSFRGYLRTICQRRWINELKRREKFTPDIEDQLEPDAEDYFWEKMVDAEKLLLFRNHIAKLPGRCRQILELSFEQFNLREIAEQLELNYNFVRRRCSECTNLLFQNIKNDPIYKDLIQE